MRIAAFHFARRILLVVAAASLATLALAADPKPDAAIMHGWAIIGGLGEEREDADALFRGLVPDGPYVEGQYVAFVPSETLKPYLTPEGQRIFGGARPEGDDDGTR